MKRFLRCLVLGLTSMSVSAPNLYARVDAQENGAPNDDQTVTIGERFTLDSEVLGEERSYWVYLPASYEHAVQRFVFEGVDFLMRYIRWHEYKIARPRFGDIFEFFSPAHACLATDDIDDALKRAMMMCTGFGIRVDFNRASP